MAVMGITTVVGCKVDCKFCPQKAFVSAYLKRSRIIEMSFDTFKKCVDKIPNRAIISMCGFAEPWLNRECTKMLLYAASKGYRIRVLTTLVGMRGKDVEMIKDVPFEFFLVHLPDEEGHAKIKIDEEYLKVLKKIVKSKIHNLSYMTMGTVPLKIGKIINKFVSASEICSVAGSIDIEDARKIKRLRGEIKCGMAKDRFNQNTLLPNGDVVLCCVDFGMKHYLGNLLKQDYSSLFNNQEFFKLRRGLKDEKIDILCRDCEFAQKKNRSFFERFSSFMRFAKTKSMPVYYKIMRQRKLK